MIYTSGAPYINGAMVQWNIGIRGNEKLISGTFKYSASILEISVTNLIGINGHYENIGYIFSGNNQYEISVTTTYYNEGTVSKTAIYALDLKKIFMENPTISIGVIPFIGIASNGTQISHYSSLQIQTEGIA